MARRKQHAGTLNNPHDKLFNAVFGRPEHATDLVRALVPELAALGMSALSPMPTNSVDAKLRERYSDLRYSARLRNHTLCVVLEHKSTVERLAALDMCRHVIDIATDHARARPRRRPPLIIPIVVYHGAKPWNAPRAFEGLCGGSRRTRKTLRKRLFRGSFVLYDVARDGHDRADPCAGEDAGLASLDQALRARGLKPLATLTLWLLANARTAGLVGRLHRVLDLMEEVLSTPGGLEDFIMLMDYSIDVSDVTFEELDEYLTRALGTRTREEYMTVAQHFREQGRQQGLKRGRQQGLKRGRQQGLEDGRRSLLLMQLEHRFGTLPPHVLDRVKAATGAELDVWARRLLSASTLDSVFSSPD